MTCCDPMKCSTPGFPVHHQLPEFTQIHIHWIGGTIQPSQPLSSDSRPTFNLSQHQGLFLWVSSSHQVAQVLKTLESPLDCKEIKSVLNTHWKDWWWSWKSNNLATWCEELTHRKRPWCWERLRAEGEGDERGWDGWMASPTQWTWVWVSSGSWWWTGEPGVLQYMGSQRVGYDWVAELNWITLLCSRN